MKRFLLCVVATAFLFGCAQAPDTSKIDELQKALEGYHGKCAELSFADSNAKMDELKRFVTSGQVRQASNAYPAAKQTFDADVAKYNDLKGSADRADAMLSSQSSRLRNIEGDAMQYASKEYADAKKRIESKHAEAASKIAECDGEGAIALLNEADRELRYIEDLVASRKSSGGSETYVVKRGDSLWKIAANKYSNPYFWPLIFWANRSSIKVADLIYPNQEFTIDRNATEEQQREAVRMARTRYDRR